MCVNIRVKERAIRLHSLFIDLYFYAEHQFQTQSSDLFEQHHTKKVGGPPPSKCRKWPQKHIWVFLHKEACRHTHTQQDNMFKQESFVNNRVACTGLLLTHDVVRPSEQSFWLWVTTRLAHEMNTFLPGFQKDLASVCFMMIPSKCGFHYPLI